MRSERPAHRPDFDADLVDFYGENLVVDRAGPPRVQCGSRASVWIPSTRFLEIVWSRRGSFLGVKSVEDVTAPSNRRRSLSVVEKETFSLLDMTSTAPRGPRERGESARATERARRAGGRRGIRYPSSLCLRTGPRKQFSPKNGALSGGDRGRRAAERPLMASSTEKSPEIIV